jgi:hypothetical protein
MGLSWSHHRVSSKPDASGPFSISWYTTQTELTFSAGAQRLASARVTQSLIGENVELHVERLASTGFVGVYFTPGPGRGRRPATVVWGGSEGGLATATCAAMLASHGIPALALAYFGEPGLPANLSRIPSRLWPFRPWSSWRPILSGHLTPRAGCAFFRAKHRRPEDLTMSRCSTLQKNSPGSRAAPVSTPASLIYFVALYLRHVAISSCHDRRKSP